MEDESQLPASAVVEECEEIFEGLNSLVDVGGGTGTMAKAIAKAFPDINCTVFDQPHVVGNLQRTHNLDFVVGDMFEKVPPCKCNTLSAKRLLSLCHPGAEVGKTSGGVGGMEKLKWFVPNPISSITLSTWNGRVAMNNFDEAFAAGHLNLGHAVFEKGTVNWTRVNLIG
ncbi:unnamed protein product [Prunus brigantina]